MLDAEVNIERSLSIPKYDFFIVRQDNLIF